MDHPSDDSLDREMLEFMQLFAGDTPAQRESFGQELEEMIAESNGILHGFGDSTKQAFESWFPRLKDFYSRCRASTGDGNFPVTRELLAERDIIAAKLVEYAGERGSAIPCEDAHRALVIVVDACHLTTAIAFSEPYPNVVPLSQSEWAQWNQIVSDDYNEACWLKQWYIQIAKQDHVFSDVESEFFYGQELIDEVKSSRAWLVTKGQSLGRGCGGSNTETWTWDGQHAVFKETCSSIDLN